MPIIHDPSPDAPVLEAFTGVADSMLREMGESGLFVGESRKVIARAIDAGLMPHAMLTDAKWVDDCAPLIEGILAANPSAPVYVVDSAGFRAITGYQVARGPVALFHRPELPCVEELCRDANRIAIIEDVNNYTNVGAVFRSAAAMGIDAVLVTPTTHDPLYRRAARVSMGTVFQVPWTRIGAESPGWPEGTMGILRELGFTTVALALADDALSIDDPVLRSYERLAMVLGSEGDGLAPRTMTECDHVAMIPMMHGVDSLNVAAASAVAFWELRRR